MSDGGQEPASVYERLKALMRELEDQEPPETQAVGKGETELRISEDLAQWYIAYKTVAAE